MLLINKINTEYFPTLYIGNILQLKRPIPYFGVRYQGENKSKKPYLELGIHSYVKSYSGNYRALYNQICYLQNEYFKQNSAEDFKFIGTIRDLANTSVQSILGYIYYSEVTDFTCEENHLYEYKWYSVQELIDRYNKATSWSKIIIDSIVDKSINKFI